MPRVDGVAFREAQLRDPELAEIPVVVCTASDEYRGHATFQGVVAFLVKPANPIRLLEFAREFSG
jgi:CheY-like chemotaxis protein